MTVALTPALMAVMTVAPAFPSMMPVTHVDTDAMAPGLDPNL